MNELEQRSARLIPPPRHIKYRYHDPLELIWLECANHLGWIISRSGDVFASWDGVTTLTLGQNADLDDDDHCAQMILHEICHALIEGPAGWSKVDWGLENIDARHLDRELGCLRLQAYWADQIGMRTFFASTTDWRAYYDLLENPLVLLSTERLTQWCEVWSTQDIQTNPQAKAHKATFALDIQLASDLDQRALILAQQGLQRAKDLGWISKLIQALKSTLQIAQILNVQIEDQETLWKLDLVR